VLFRSLEGDRWDGIAVKPAPVTPAAPQPNNLPGVFACPKCPRCRKTMEFCYSGDDPTPPTTPPPVAPPPPALQGGPAPALSGDVSLYSGSGENRGHPNVTWNITRNAQQMDITIKLMLGTKTAGVWDSVKEFKLIDRLLNTNNQVAASPADWWLEAPVSPGNHMELWHSFRLDALVGAANLGTLPATIQIGVQLGNAAWGLIHLLAGHATAVRNVGSGYDIKAFGESQVDVYRTVLLLQSGMRRFDNNSITHIYHDSPDKLVIKGSNAGMIVVTQKNKVMNGSPVYSITTIYNTQSSQTLGKKIYCGKCGINRDINNCKHT
jgi:hypothetical protein